MAPPCTPFGALSQVNRVHNREAWLKSLAIGETIAKFCSELAFTQLRHHRHFLLENPRGSELFKLTCVAALLATNKICKATFPQCSLGLLSPEGLPLLKFTTVWTSHPTLSKPFENLQCTHTVHGEIQGNYGSQNRSKLAQVWPVEFCRRVAHAVAALRRENDAKNGPRGAQSRPNGGQMAPKVDQGNHTSNWSGVHERQSCTIPVTGLVLGTKKAPKTGVTAHAGPQMAPRFP